jgi:hypothetical protein
MKSELINRVIQETGVVKSDCDRLIEISDFIASNFSRLHLQLRITIPLALLSARGYTYKDIKLLRQVLDHLDRKLSFTIVNQNCFEPTEYDPTIFYSDVEKTQLNQSIIISENSGTMSYSNWNRNELLITLKKCLPNIKGLITLKLTAEGLSRDFDETPLIYAIKHNSDRFRLLLGAIRGPQKAKQIEIFGSKKHASIKSELNKLARTKLKLPLGADLIVNNRLGYHINEKFHILP